LGYSRITVIAYQELLQSIIYFDFNVVYIYFLQETMTEEQIKGAHFKLYFI